MNQRLKSNLKAGALLALASIAFGLSAAQADEIVIGASLPISGPLAGFGSFQQWGYKRAVDEVNKAGGISIDGTKQMVKLIIRDDKTDPERQRIQHRNADLPGSRRRVARLLHPRAGERRRSGGGARQEADGDRLRSA